jgi:hypothetical protein
MKNSIKFLVVSVGFLLFSLSASAQAFQKGGMYMQVHLTGSNYWNIDVQNNWAGSTWYGSNVGGITAQAEWGIHKYVGLGAYLGLQGGFGRYYSWSQSIGGYGQLAAPVGIVANFHFYQLIADKTGNDIHADKLDVYAGLSMGSGVGVFPTPGWVSPLFFVGPHAGARYFFKPKFGVSLEAGYGKSFISGGFTFKLK